MSKLKKKKSQVSRDFEETLNVVVKAGFLDYTDENERYLEDSYVVPVTTKISISETKDDFGRNSFLTTTSDNSRTLLSQISHEIKEANVFTDLEISTDDNKQKSKHSNKTENEINKMYSSKNKISAEKITRIPYFLRILFPDKKESSIPFESTSISNLSFPLKIIMSNEESFFINVRKYFTTDKLISLISKKMVLKYEKICLFHKNNRLEKHRTLSSYDVTVKSHLKLTILKKIEILMQFSNKQYSLSAYTSQCVCHIKFIISKKLKIDPDSVDLTYNDIELKNNKELFLYGIEEKSLIKMKIIVETSKKSLLDGNSPGFEIAQRYYNMTSALETCDCKGKRLNAISMGILAVLNRTLKDYDKTILTEFDNNLHHISCIKNKNRNSSYSSASGNSLSFESEISDISTNEISLDDCIYAEIDRVEKNRKMTIEEADLEFLCNVTNFKEFKHFLKDKLGRECTLRSVSMLYKYGIELVTYIGCNEEQNPYVKKILHYIKLYFQKYYEKSIINKGGLVALTLTGSDVED